MHQHVRQCWQLHTFQHAVRTDPRLVVEPAPRELPHLPLNFSARTFQLLGFRGSAACHPRLTDVSLLCSMRWDASHPITLSPYRELETSSPATRSFQSKFGSDGHYGLPRNLKVMPRSLSVVSAPKHSLNRWGVVQRVTWLDGLPLQVGHKSSPKQGTRL